MSEIIIITGASQGIGRASALRLAAPGCSLLLSGYRHPDALFETAREAEQKGARVSLFTDDLSVSENCRLLIRQCTKVFGTPDILINNAGISHVELFQDSGDEHYREILNANLSSAVSLSREAVREMLKVHRGRILNISSVWGITGASCEVEYSLTKGALNSFTKALAKELAPSGIAVNALAPGAVDTGMNAHLSDNEKAELADSIPIGRMASPDEVAEMIALILKAPLYLTGAVIPFDGGWI